ncbi:tyrosine-type recombinase/integrase [Rhodococcus qingshengii]|uniref:tyrosine-type recombinase/integrase n=1 Tax=Rhodococcus qingshengii TaxID=334542 RepID=UPI0021B0C514|nr:tyrosine-type recombinase/integrase [Rhodococcus qingshengii]MCT6733813.1 tyrosine-type recombinase/integrase [Rhodococcus qingshengii]MCY4669930.1 tyrosine-type recombinase/integrase [Rhodococcus sp. (in: high G+C Gram-positive bacteria)]
MTAPHHDSASGLLAKLMAGVRGEFRSDVLQFAATDPVFGGGTCRVGDCGRSARGHGLCQGHYQRWVYAGRPDIEKFATSTDPRWRKHRPNQACRVEDCGYGSARGGQCQLHAQRWERAGRPHLARWLRDPQPVKAPRAEAVCRIGHCELWPQSTSAFCHSHTTTWRANGRPAIGEFAARFESNETPANEMIQLGMLPPQLKLEMQYVLQQRHTERRGKLTPTVVARVVRLLVAASVTSLLDHDTNQWRERSAVLLSDTRSRGLLLYAHATVSDLAEAGGWEAEYPRDIWRMHRLGYEGRYTLRFDRIPQHWLREPAKRWIRLRLSRGLSLEAGGGRPVLAIARFGRFLAEIGIDDIDLIDRELLERYLAHLNQEYSPQRRGGHIGLLNGYFAAIRQHHWDTRLPATSMFFAEDHPKRSEQLPKALAEHVMTQLEHPDNIDKFADPTYRLITVILMRCGLRITDALRLRGDCVTTDAGGAPYLRYFNHKMKRDALVPIDPDLADAIGDQRRSVAERWPGGTHLLFPRPTKNIDGHLPLAIPTYREALHRWLTVCDIRDEHGHRVHLTPHQWRHTLGTRLINRDVPQEVVRRILDHDSPQMTAHYARMHDTTVRRAWEAARKVDIHGDTVTLDPDGPLAEAAWAKQRLGRATQALPNGYCGLPVQQSCPHANACLTCPMFLTTPEFLPQHHTHRQQTLELITAAEARGHTRLVEMNRQVLDNLDTIITSLDTPTAESEEAEHAN